MDAHGVKLADFIECGDASGGGDLVAGRGAQAAEPIEVGALHHAFFVDIGAQEAAAEGLELAEDVLSGEPGRLTPAFDDDVAVFRIESDDDAFGSDEGGDFFEGGGEGGGSDDDAVSALVDEAYGPLDSADSAADAAAGAGGEQFHHCRIFPVAHGGVQINDLNFGEGGKAAEHFERGIAFQGFFAALHQLHDLAVHEIDARKDHNRTGTRCAAR